MQGRSDLQRLERSLRHAYAQQMPGREVAALLRALLSHPGTTLPAHPQLQLELSECLLRSAKAGASEAWEAARLAARVAKNPECPAPLRARAEAAQGLAQTLLGNYRSARAAYYRALRSGSQDPSVAHNLGHLLASVFHDGPAALGLLEAAQRALPEDPEVAASLAHALARFGQPERAAAVLQALGCTSTDIEALLEAWRDSSAPAHREAG